MKIVRDAQGKISEIIKDESDGDFNVVDIFKAEIEADKDFNITKEKEITEREREITARTKEKCNFFLGCTSVAAKAIIAGIDEYNRQQSFKINFENSESSEEEGY